MAKLLVSGVVEGVDFTKAGTFKNSDGDVVSWDDSIRLQLSTVVEVIKQGIKTKTKRSFSVVLPFDGDLESSVKQFNSSYIGKQIECSFVPSDGQKFNLSGDIRVVSNK